MDFFAEMLAAGHPVSEWSNGPGYSYPAHSHAYEKILSCVEGSITFHLEDRDEHLSAGDRLIVEAGVLHSATVGDAGVRCLEAQVRSDEESVVVSGEAGRYDVEVSSRGSVSAHTVEVPTGYSKKLGWGEHRELEVVRESFAFLLEREPASSILPSFRLDVISRYFPEYESEMKRRSGRPG